MQTERLKILHLSPVLRGSHLHFAEGLKKYSAFEFKTLGFKKLNWFSASLCSPLLGSTEKLTPLDVAETFKPDFLLCTDFCNLPGFIAFHRQLGNTPSILYMHENQLTYPLHSPKKPRNEAIIWQTLQTCSWVNEIWFNSKWHFEDFFEGLKKFQTRFPIQYDFETSLREKSRVVYPCIDFDGLPTLNTRIRKPNEENCGPIKILWNHRNDYDKGFARLVPLLRQLVDANIPFQWIHLGESKTDGCEKIDRLVEVLGNRLIHVGRVEDRIHYLKWLERADIVISLSDHEFFGMSVLEAIRAGCFPLLPNRLSYPELISATLQDYVLYEKEKDLYKRLVYFAKNPEIIRSPPIQESAQLIADAERFSFAARIKELDGLFLHFFQKFNCDSQNATNVQEFE